MKNIFLIYLLFSFFSLTMLANEKQIEVGIDEQLGKIIPLQEYFVDENGNKVLLKDLFTKPTVFSFVYYNCPGICSPLLLELTNVINKTDLVIGVDFNVVVISMDELETPKDAVTKKQTFFQAFDKNVPPESWQFLTGDSATIKKIADAAGFHYKRKGKDFLHTGAFIFVDNKGKICRYLIPSYTDRRGFGILPFDFKMAVLETSEGKISPTMAKVLQLCFRYDPQGKTYVLNLTQIFGAGILFLVGLFLLYLRFKPKKDFIKTR
jgi:protein SCO1/2